jgi:hypothetical protein
MPMICSSLKRLLRMRPLLFFQADFLISPGDHLGEHVRVSEYPGTRQGFTLPPITCRLQVAIGPEWAFRTCNLTEVGPIFEEVTMD